MIALKMTDREHQLVIATIAVVVFFTSLGTTALWDRDETRNAGCAREMLESGDYIVPTFNGELRTAKPPLLYWLTVASFRLLGVNEFAARLPSALCGLATILATFHLGRILFHSAVGFLGAVVLSTSTLFAISARAATHDSLFVLLITLALLLFARELVLPGRKRAAAYLPMYFLLALAVLTKGPTGFLIPTMIMALTLTARTLLQSAEIKTTQEQKGLGFRTGPARFYLESMVDALRQIRPLLGVAILLVVAGPWFLLVSIQTDGEFLREFLGYQHLTRFLNPLEGHGGPFFYYFLVFLAGFFPWSTLLFPLAVQIRNELGARCSTRRMAYVFFALWVAAYLILFSMAGTKLPNYLLPAAPAIAILVGSSLQSALSERLSSVDRWLPWVGVALAISGALLWLGLSIAATMYLPGEKLLGLIGFIPMLGGILCIFFARKERWRQLAATLGLTALVFAMTVVVWGAIRTDRYQNVRILIQTLQRQTESQHRLAAFRFLEPSFVFYARQKIDLLQTSGEAFSFLSEPESFLITTELGFAELSASEPGTLRVLARHPRFLGSGNLLILGSTASSTSD